ncbi:MAG: hypothetical protein Q9191_008546 [Dirinaria sp. TL-2023a]
MDDTRQQAKELVCTIIAVTGGELHKKVALFKAFYYAHLFYWQEHQEALTDHPIVRMPQGPGIDDHTSILRELEGEARIEIRREPYGPYQEYVYKLKSPFTIDPGSPHHTAVERAVKWVQGKSAMELSEEAHDYSRSWQIGQDGQELNIYIDLLDDAEYVEMNRRLRASEEMVNDVFAEVG